MHKVYLHLELKELYSRGGAKKKKSTGLARWTEPEEREAGWWKKKNVSELLVLTLCHSYTFVLSHLQVHFTYPDAFSSV